MMTSPSSLRIAHVADLHIGAGYVHGDEDKGGVNSRLVDFREAWTRSCQQMVDAQVNLVLFAGDGYQDAKPTPTEEAALRAGLDILCDADTDVLMVPGNHDIPRSIGRTHALQIFQGYRAAVDVQSKPGVVTFRYGDITLPVACFPWVSRAHLAAQDPEFEKLSLDEQNQQMVELSLQVLRALGAEAEQLAGPLGCLLVAHGSIAGSQIGAAGSTAFLREAVLPLPELKGLPFVAQLWGHLHRKQTLCSAPFIGYSGSIERTDFAEAEEDKGWFLLTLSEDGPQVSWGSSNPRPFLTIDLEDPPNWEHELARCIGVKDAVVRVRWTTSPEVAKTINQAAIGQVLRAAGAKKVYMQPSTERIVTEASDALTEDTDMLTGWNQYADLQGFDGLRRERLNHEVIAALEVRT